MIPPRHAPTRCRAAAPGSRRGPTSGPTRAVEVHLLAAPTFQGAVAPPSKNGEDAGAHDSLLYGEFSKVYDLIFARVFYPRIARTIRQLAIPAGSRVLEVGVG